MTASVSTGQGSIRLETEPGQPIARLIVSQPGKGNAVTLHMIREFIDRLQALSEDDTIKVVVLMGDGADLSTGIDLDEAYDIYRQFPGGGGKFPAQRTRVYFHDLLWGPQGLFQRLLSLRKMVILAAQGRCWDTGLYMSLCSDIVVGTPDLKIGNPRWKFAGADGDLSLLTATVGPKRAKQMVFVENVLDAEQAKDWKLIDLIVPGEKLDETVMALATTLTGIPRDAIATGKPGSAGHFAEHMDKAVTRAAVLSNILYRDGEFIFLRERRNRGTKGAVEAAEKFARGEPVD